MSIKKLLIAIITIVITVDAGGRIQTDVPNLEISLEVYSIIDFSVFETIDSFTEKANMQFYDDDYYKFRRRWNTIYTKCS